MAASFLSYGAWGLLLWAVYQAVRFMHRVLTSPMRDLPGPPSDSFLYGNMGLIGNPNEHDARTEKWIGLYGRTFRTASFFNAPRLYTTDVRAINRFMNNSDIYQKPEPVRYNLSQSLGHGLLVAEGDAHKLQRRIISPAFGPSQIRAVTGIFLEKATQLADNLSAQVVDNQGSAQINVVQGLNNATLDIIGEAGFGYQFNALTSLEPNELSRVLHSVNKGGRVLFARLQAFVPPLRIIPTSAGRQLARARADMNRIGKQLLANAKASMVASEKDGDVSSGARDLLSLLVKSNMAAEGPRLSDAEVLAQVPTFFVAGHDTTSTSVTWTLFALSNSPDVQKKLRAELLACPTATPSMEDLNHLPYLENVVREVLRLYSPVHQSVRVAVQDDIVQLDNPFVDVKGVTRNELRIRKGDLVTIPIMRLHKSKEIWGDDVGEFRPERWDAISSESLKDIPSGVYSHLMTFLGGPHACVGWRFSIVEMKAILFVLLRRFEFSLAVPRESIISKSAVVSRPYVKGRKQSELPLNIKLVSED